MLKPLRLHKLPLKAIKESGFRARREREKKKIKITFDVGRGRNSLLFLPPDGLLSEDDSDWNTKHSLLLMQTSNHIEIVSPGIVI